MKKNNILWMALAATLMATAWAFINDQQEPEMRIPNTRKAKIAVSRHLAGVTESQAVIDVLSGWQRVKIERDPLPLFSASAIALAGEHQEQPTNPPQMPTLPFIYAGKLFDGAVFTVFLISGEKTLTVQKGDVVDEVWRVSEIRPPKMIFKYLPLKLETVMDIGENK